MGYSEVTKGYVLYNMLTNTFFISRDVSFREDTFPFHSSTPTAPPFVDVSIDFFENVLLDIPELVADPSHLLPKKSAPDSTVESSAAFIDAVIPVVPPIAQPFPSWHSTTCKKKPTWMTDYVTNHAAESFSYPLSHSLSHDGLSSHYQSYLLAFSCVAEPQSYQDACSDPKWIAAMQEEIQVLEANKTWILVPLPPKAPWVLVRKHCNLFQAKLDHSRLWNCSSSSRKSSRLAQDMASMHKKNKVHF
ncbi:uncharacterized protein LOC107877840 isoform X1 [Capsicum annuum]|uniref:uncharacterized protein LOC107877840 isoform X1 n=1 Tax=Capsicum annuum TaxID=4072 RepID=UPI001FB14D63|nr:uncharacterized protein LOC107877840 isoform X1 [Capsicum annuum]